MKKSWYRRRIKKLAVIWALIIIFASAALSMLPGKKADAVGEDQNVYYKYYDNVRIEKGDTLWGLWKKSANQGETWDAFSKRIRQENPQLDLDKPLAIGTRLNGINLA